MRELSNLRPVLHDCPEDLLRPGGEWDSLLQQSDTNTVFLSGAWLTAVLKARASADKILAPVIHRDGGLVSAAAFVSRNGLVEFLGTGPCDYLDLLVHRNLTSDEKLQCKRALLIAAAEATPGFRCFLLRNVPGNSTTVDQLEASGLFVTPFRQTPAPAMEMSAAEEALKKKSIRRHFNKLSKMGELASQTFSDAEAVEPMLEEFFAQHIARWEGTPSPSLFLDPENKAIFRSLARELGEAGTLRFTQIRLDGRLIAAHFGAMYNGVFTWYKPTYDPELGRLSPGEVLLKTLIEQAQNEHASEFDFTIGDEAFKSRFATLTRSVYDLHVTTSPLRATVFRLSRQIKATLKTTLIRLGAWQRLKSLLGR